MHTAHRHQDGRSFRLGRRIRVVGGKGVDRFLHALVDDEVEEVSFGLPPLRGAGKQQRPTCFPHHVVADPADQDASGPITFGRGPDALFRFHPELRRSGQYLIFEIQQRQHQRDTSRIRGVAEDLRQSLRAFGAGHPRRPLRPFAFGRDPHQHRRTDPAPHRQPRIAHQPIDGSLVETGPQARFRHGGFTVPHLHLA